MLYSGALLWNSLPQEVRSLSLFFAKKLQNDYYTSVYSIDSRAAIL